MFYIGHCWAGYRHHYFESSYYNLGGVYRPPFRWVADFSCNASCGTTSAADLSKVSTLMNNRCCACYANNAFYTNATGAEIMAVLQNAETGKFYPVVCVPELLTFP